MSESEILRDIEEYLQYLKNQGKIWYMRCNSGMAYLGSGKHRYAVKLAPEGTADLLVLNDTRVIWIEVKDEKGKQSEAQVEFQKEIEALECEYIIARSLDDVVKLGLDLDK